MHQLPVIRGHPLLRHTSTAVQQYLASLFARGLYALLPAAPTSIHSQQQQIPTWKTRSSSFFWASNDCMLCAGDPTQRSGRPKKAQAGGAVFLENVSAVQGAKIRPGAAETCHRPHLRHAAKVLPCNLADSRLACMPAMQATPCTTDPREPPISAMRCADQTAGGWAAAELQLAASCQPAQHREAWCTCVSKGFSACTGTWQLRACTTAALIMPLIPGLLSCFMPCRGYAMTRAGPADT